MLMSIALVNQASAEGFKIKPKTVNLTFEKAIQNHSLVISMYQQLDDDFLNNNQHVYIVKVRHQATDYQISGTYEQWKMFFSLKWNLLIDRKKFVAGSD